jgi:hypothetical protein
MGVSDEAKNVIPLKFLRKIKYNFFFPFVNSIRGHTVYGFCIFCSGSPQQPLTFFFSNVCTVTPRLKAHFARNTTHYLFLEYFQSLRAKK